MYSGVVKNGSFYYFEVLQRYTVVRVYGSKTHKLSQLSIVNHINQAIRN
jgi:hypothetical protein